MYVQNTFATLTETSDDDDNDVQTVMMQVAALTTQSQQMVHTVAKTSASVATEIHQLADNQQTMQQHFAAFTRQHNTTYHQGTSGTATHNPVLDPQLCKFPNRGLRRRQTWWQRTWWTCKFCAHRGPQCTHPIRRLCWTWRTREPNPHKQHRRTRLQNAPFCATTHAAQHGSTVFQHT